ncbi:MAG: hypothetical protein IJU79_05820 [Desulfovibrionaceae bacterium]|nr:hypothetical protein [Desulfovibrionaceae bacterium]
MYTNPTENVNGINILEMYQDAHAQTLEKVNPQVQTAVEASNILDSEAQAALSLVGTDLNANIASAQNVHSGLDYARVMQLLEDI